MHHVWAGCCQAAMFFIKAAAAMVAVAYQAGLARNNIIAEACVQGPFDALTPPEKSLLAIQWHPVSHSLQEMSFGHSMASEEPKPPLTQYQVHEATISVLVICFCLPHSSGGAFLDGHPQ